MVEGYSTSRSSRWTRTSFNSSATASGSSIRATRARWYDAAGVKEKFGLRPDQVVDAMALMGDTIDNIKGVPGIGEKGARELIGKYETLDNLIAHASELTPKRRETLLANVEAAHQSRELARIHVNVPVEFDPEAFRYRGSSRERCFAIFNDLGFRTIVAEYAPTAASVAKTYRIVNTEDGVRALAARLQANGSFAFRVLPDCPSAMRGVHRRRGVLDLGARGRLCAHRPSGARRHRVDAARDGGRAAEAAVRKPRRAEGVLPQ